MIGREIQQRVRELLPDPVPPSTEAETSTFPAITEPVRASPDHEPEGNGGNREAGLAAGADGEAGLAAGADGEAGLAAGADGEAGLAGGRRADGGGANADGEDGRVGGSRKPGRSSAG